MAPSESHTTWATRKDWDFHRSLITYLYTDAKLTRKGVDEFMGDHYGFHATESMYKKKFSEWGVGKNLKAKHVEEALSSTDLDQLQEDAEIHVHHRRVPVSSLRRHVRRNRALRERLVGTAAADPDSYDCAENPFSPPGLPLITVSADHKIIPGAHECLRCHALGIECIAEEGGSSSVCYACLRLVDTPDCDLILAGSDCIRTRFEDVNIFEDCVLGFGDPGAEASDLHPDLKNVTLSFPVIWRLDDLVHDISRWLEDPIQEQGSKVGTLAAPAFLDLIKDIIEPETAVAFQRMLFASSLAHVEAAETSNELRPSTRKLVQIGASAGQVFIRKLAQYLNPTAIYYQSKEKLQTIYLLTLGTILSAGYAMRPFITPSGDGRASSTAKPPSCDLWNAKREQICRMLSHYLVLVGSWLRIQFSYESQRHILDKGHLLWQRQGDFVWDYDGDCCLVPSNTIQEPSITTTSNQRLQHLLRSICFCKTDDFVDRERFTDDGFKMSCISGRTTHPALLNLTPTQSKPRRRRNGIKDPLVAGKRRIKCDSPRRWLPKHNLLV